MFDSNQLTFLIGLATLVVLCVVWKGNFILTILDDIKRRMQHQIDRMRGHGNLDDLLKTQSYQTIESFHDAWGKTSGASPKLQSAGDELNSQAEALLMDIGMRQNQFQTEQVSDEIGRCKDRLKTIKKMKEPIKAPWYTFMLILVLTTLYFFVGSGGRLYDSSMVMMAWLVYLSTIFWCLMWIKGMIIVSRRPLHRENTFVVRWRDWGFLKTIVGTTVVLMVAILSLCGLIDHYHLATDWLMLAILSCFTIIVGGLGLSKAWMTRHNGRFPYRHVIHHFFVIFWLSILASVACYFYCHVEYMMLMVIEHKDEIVKGLLLFSVLNGIVLPFMVPYFLYWRQLNRAESIVRHFDTQAQRAQRELEDSLSSLSQAINQFQRRNRGN